jgi:glutathione peroxidase
MKIGLILAIVLLVAVSVVGLLWARKTFSADMTRPDSAAGASLYSLKATALDGSPVDLATFKGKVALVVNTASKCGLTPQYKGLEAMYRELSDKGFVVLGFPSNDFMKQEPGTAEEIAEFCQVNYGVTFPLFAKGPVTGETKGEVFQLLTKELEEPTWNFTKYLVDQEGKVVARFGPRTTPEDEKLRAAIMELLGS